MSWWIDWLRKLPEAGIVKEQLALADRQKADLATKITDLEATNKQLKEENEILRQENERFKTPLQISTQDIDLQEKHIQILELAAYAYDDYVSINAIARSLSVEYVQAQLYVADLQNFDLGDHCRRANRRPEGFLINESGKRKLAELNRIPPRESVHNAIRRQHGV